MEGIRFRRRRDRIPYARAAVDKRKHLTLGEGGIRSRRRRDRIPYARVAVDRPERLTLGEGIRSRLRRERIPAPRTNPLAGKGSPGRERIARRDPSGAYLFSGAEAARAAAP